MVECARAEGQCAGGVQSVRVRVRVRFARVRVRFGLGSGVQSGPMQPLVNGQSGPLRVAGADRLPVALLCSHHHTTKETVCLVSLFWARL